MVSLKPMWITPEKCKYNIYFGKENIKRELTLLLQAWAPVSPLQTYVQCWRKPRLLPLLGYERKYSVQISGQRHSRQCTYKRNNEARSCNHCCNGKVISINYCGSVCGLSYAMRMCHIGMCGLPRFTLFPVLSKKGKIFEKSYWT